MSGTRTHPGLEESRRIARTARCDAGTTYEQIAESIGIGYQRVYTFFDSSSPRHLRYGDILAMSRDTRTTVHAFVCLLLEPIQREIAKWKSNK